MSALMLRDNEAGWLFADLSEQEQMPDCTPARWPASHLAASAMNGYGATSTGSRPMPRPTGGSAQTLPFRSGCGVHSDGVLRR
jgi:hypothetical protein